MTRISAPAAPRLAIRAVAAIALSAMTAACAGPDPALQRNGPNDPYEQSNRKNHKQIKALDSNVLRPVAKGYSAAVPDPVERAVSNFSTNLSLPGAMVNSALQGNGVGLTSDFYRFLVNTTVGIGGLIDVATELNMPSRTDADFGQTLYTWGVHEGPYIELPLVGPNTSRHAVGRVVDIFTNPLGYMINDTETYYALGARGGKALTNRARYSDSIDDVLYDSADSYAAARDYYLQNRRYKVGGGGSAGYVDPYDLNSDTPANASGAASADFEDPYDQ